MYVGQMCGSDWRLAARVSGAPFLVIVNPSDENPTQYRLYGDAGPASLPALVAEIDIPAESPHFPYGNDVEPDNAV